MPDYSPNPQFEKEIRDSLPTPQPNPEFVKALHARLLDQASTRSQPTPRPIFLRRAWLAPAALLLLVVTGALIIGPQRVWAAVAGLFGYVPEIGLVRNDGSLRLLAEPVQQVRDGITLKVLQGAADAQRTVIIYQADGLSIAAANSQGEGAATGGLAALLLPDGTILAQQDAGGPGWGTGYQDRLTFPPLPASAADAILLIGRLQSMPAGAAPEDWRVPLRFKPAPADLHVMPVYELSTPTGALVSQESNPTAPTVLPLSAPASPGLSNAADRNGVRVSLDRVIDQGAGYQLEGSAAWDSQKYTSVSFNPFGSGSFTLADANGQMIPFEETQPDNGGSGGQSFSWALRTNNKDYPGPWKLTIPSLLVYQQIQAGQAAFEVDFGSNPQVGQTWQFDQHIRAAGRELRLVSARLNQDPRSQSLVMDFVLTADPDLTGIGLEDPQNQAGPGEGAGGGGGGGDGPSPTEVPGTIRTGIPYYHKPAGAHKIAVLSLSYTLTGPWQVEWTPPLVAAGAVPTQPAPACMNLSRWQQLKTGPAAALPAGLSGRLLLESYTGQLMPQLSLVSPDGAQPQKLSIGGWSALSPDGARVAFVTSNGPSLFVQDVHTGEIRPIPGTTPEDYHALWSSDGQWIAFVRSLSGIYAIHPDGSGLTQVTTSATLSFLVGWLPDNRTLVITTLGSGGSQVQTVDIQTRAVEDQFTIKNAKGAFARISPDGQRLAFSENTFGLPSYGVYVANLDGSDKRLVAGLEAGAASAGAWSPDGKWLAVTVSEESGGDTIQSLVAVQPDTCQALFLPGLSGQVTDWQ